MGILKQRLNTDDAGVKAVLEGMHAQYNEQQQAKGEQTKTYDEYVQFVVAQYYSMYGNNPAYVPSEDWSIPALEPHTALLPGAQGRQRVA